MGVFDHPEFDDHEAVHYLAEAETGLKAIIAVHSTALGPAAGGCRRWTYASDGDALTDALRLSRGMTYKNAVAGLRFGGGKAVIINPSQPVDNAALFQAFGRAVESLGGRYVTAEDVGVSTADMFNVSRETSYVSGLPKSGRGAGGDPSPLTALGVFLGIRAALAARLKTDSFKDLRVAVQGVGHVGLHLCRLLHDAGAKLVVTDVNADNLAMARDEFDADQVAPTDILHADVDVLAPCALGNVLTSQTIPGIKASVIAGAANNQLATPADGRRLMDRDILYAPDYVINAGGIINVAREYFGEGSEADVRNDIERIPERLTAIFDASAETGRPTNELADELARRLVAAGGESATAPAPAAAAAATSTPA